MTEEHKREHKYRVIRRLEAGGMAEVFYGEAKGVQGFKKRVAIKRVLPHLAQNENFIQMFLDEARLSARLNHANIVSVFDIEPWKDTFQLIMEFVDGANLKRIMDYLHAHDMRFSLGQATFICMEACRGLSYAHELMDEGGEALGIVHRDISPPNIMVTQRGEVKVADFGLAKAGTQLSQTDPGVVKGKFGYLSPEAAEGREVDARADLFSLGIVLWEMLAGRRLFLGESDYATVKLVQQANVPRLSPLNSEVDEGFEEVLMRALMRDPEQRYRSAQEFGDALADYLFTRQLKVTAYDLAGLVKVATSGEAGVGAHAKDSSLIHRLIRQELDDESGENRLSAVPTHEDSSMTPIPGGGDFEDPATWFSDEELATAGTKPSLAPKPPLDMGHSGSWREAGLEMSDASAPGTPVQPPGSTSTPPSADRASHVSNPPPIPRTSTTDASSYSHGVREDDTSPTITTLSPDEMSGHGHGAGSRARAAHSTGVSKVVLAAVVLVAMAVVAGALAINGGL